MSQSPEKERRSNSSLSMLGFLLAMSMLGFLSQFQWAGYLIIGMYAVVVIWKKIPVRITFLAAMLSLGMVPIAIIVANWLVAQNFAAYSFVLFVLAMAHMTISLQRELHPKKLKKQR